MAYRVASRTSGELVAEGMATIVSYDYTAGRKVPLPEAVRAAIALLEAQR